VIRDYVETRDRPWAEARMEAEWGGALQARRGELHDVLALPGFVAEEGGYPLGIATYRLEGEECELAFIEAFRPLGGVGTALLDAVVGAAAGCRRVWVVTTNDNLDALRFYQRRGFRLAALRPGAVDVARETLKPQIGRVGSHGVSIRDEIELVLDLE
jgi:ribosomal protein S18 acetylase RimI-like enzyme